MIFFIKNSLNRLKKKNILLVIQFFIGFFSLFFALSFIDETYQTNQQVRSIVPGYSLQVTCGEEDFDLSEKEEKRRITEVQKSIDKIKKISDVKVFMFDMLYFGNDEGEAENSMEGIMLHYDAMEQMDFDLVEGSIEKLKTYNGGRTVPVIVSEKMSATYPIGAEFLKEEISKSLDKNKYDTFVVVGVFSEKMSYFRGNCSFGVDTVSRNDDMIFFMPEVNESKNIISYENNIFYIPQDGSDNSIEKKIAQIYSENDLNATISSIDFQLQQKYDGKKMMLFVVTFFSSVLLLLTSLGCMGTVLASILNRKEEFGIYVALGFTKKRLFYLVIGELLSICMLSFLLAFGLFALVLDKIHFVYANDISFGVVGIAVLSLIICLMLSLLIPLKKLKSLSIIDLMEGR